MDIFAIPSPSGCSAAVSRCSVSSARDRPDGAVQQMLQTAEEGTVVVTGALEPHDRARSKERASGPGRTRLAHRGSASSAEIERRQIGVGKSRRPPLRTRFRGLNAVLRGTAGIDVHIVADPTGGSAAS
jgi:hypothetical protein